MQTCGKTTINITLEALPGFADNGRDNLLLQVVRYMKHLFTEQMAADVRLVLPSVADLAGFFGCSPLDILDAFYELRRQGYTYAMDDLYRPVVFEDVMAERADAEGHQPSVGKSFSTLAKFSDLLRQKFA